MPAFQSQSTARRGSSVSVGRKMRPLSLLALILVALTAVYAEGKKRAQSSDYISLYAHTTPTIQLPWAKGESHEAFDYEPDVTFFFAGSVAARPDLPAGTDSGGELVCMAPSRVVLETSDGKQIRATYTLREIDHYVSLELKPLELFRVKMMAPHPGVFKIEEAGRYRLVAECKLTNPDGEEFTLRSEEFWISFEERDEANQRPDGTPVKSPPSSPGQVSGVPHP